MSIANLFAPNDYQLNAKTLTVSEYIIFGSTGSIYAIIGDPALPADVGGAVTQADFILLSAFRLNDTVTIRWQPNSAVAAIATAAQPLNTTEAISERFRPTQVVTGTASVVGDVAGVQNTFPGLIAVTPAGVVSFTFASATHGGDQNWAIGERVNVIGGSFTYTTLEPL